MDEETQQSNMDMETHEFADGEFCSEIFEQHRLSPTPSCSSEGEKAPEMHMEHFKCTYDQAWDYEKIANRFFLADQPCLVMKEHINQPNTHVHFQGWTDITAASFAKKRKLLAKHHYSRKTMPKSRPITCCTRPADVMGFQYMCKEQHAPLYARGFSEAQLVELQEKSQGHVKALKTKVIDLIKEMPAELLPYQKALYEIDIKPVIVAIQQYLWPKLESGEITFSKYLKADIVKGLIARKDVPLKLRAPLLSFNV